MYFDGFYNICLISECILDGKSISQWEHHIDAITCDEGIECYSRRIELFYFEDNFPRIALRVLAFCDSKVGSTK